MQHCITNVVGVDARRRFDGTITLQVVMHNKYQKFLELMNMTATTEMRRVMALGDGLNDIEMLTAVRNGGGLAVAINPISDEVAMAANAAIHDFTELKKYAERQ
jgi:phosphoserine phosphatase